MKKIFLLVIVAMGITFSTQTFAQVIINFDKSNVKKEDLLNYKKRTLIIPKDMRELTLYGDKRTYEDTMRKETFVPFEHTKKLTEESEWKFNKGVEVKTSEEISKIKNKANYMQLIVVQYDLNCLTNVYKSYFTALAGYSRWYLIPLERMDEWNSKLTNHQRYRRFLSFPIPSLTSTTKIGIDLSLKMFDNYLRDIEPKKPQPLHLIYKSVSNPIPNEEIFLSENILYNGLNQQKQIAKYKDIFGPKLSILDDESLEVAVKEDEVKYLVVQLASYHNSYDKPINLAPDDYRWKVNKLHSQHKVSAIVDIKTGEILYTWGAKDGNAFLDKKFFKGAKANVK